MANDCPNCARYRADAIESGERFTALKRQSREKITFYLNTYNDLWWAHRDLRRKVADAEALAASEVAWPTRTELDRGDR